MKYFVVSDIHAYYDEFISSLNEKGYDKNNKEHMLIVLGDIFDRGNKPLEVYEFLLSIPKERRVLVRGNHELLLIELARKRYADYFDYTNGTYNTLESIALSSKETGDKSELDNIADIALRNLYSNEKLKTIISWIKSDEWVNFYEINNYIFVHAFIPLKNLNYGWPYPFQNPKAKFYRSWRGAPQEERSKAMWLCPWAFYKGGFFKDELLKGKILVCGHFNTASFYNNLDYIYEFDKQLDDVNENPIYISSNFKGIIGLDACTCVTGRVNVLVLDL